MIGLLIITHETIGEAYRGLTHHFSPKAALKTCIFWAQSQMKTKTT